MWREILIFFLENECSPGSAVFDHQDHNGGCSSCDPDEQQPHEDSLDAEGDGIVDDRGMTRSVWSASRLILCHAVE